MGYEVTQLEDVPITDLAEVDGVPPDHDIRAVGDALGLENQRLSVWYFEEGDEIQYHAHAEQEEVYYVMDGEFSLKLGRSGETEYVDAGPGTFWVAKPEIGHGHRCVSDSGTILAMGAPPVHDPGLDPHSLGE